MVTAIARGEATITATTDDGGFTNECSVTVTPVTVTISLSANPATSGDVTGDGTFNKGAEITIIATLHLYKLDRKRKRSQRKSSLYLYRNR